MASASFLFIFFQHPPCPLLIQLIYLLYLSDKDRLRKYTVSQFGRAYTPVWALSYGNINDKLCHLLGVAECSASPGPVPLAFFLCPPAKETFEINQASSWLEQLVIACTGLKMVCVCMWWEDFQQAVQNYLYYLGCSNTGRVTEVFLK